MPKLIECPYCKKIALYEESHAESKDNDQQLIWNCRYCNNQITRKEVDITPISKAEAVIDEDSELQKIEKEKI